MTKQLFGVRTYGRVYRSSGATLGVTGEIRGLTADYVRLQMVNHERRGDAYVVLDEHGDVIPRNEVEIALGPPSRC